MGRLSRGLSPFARDAKGGRVEVLEGAITTTVRQGVSELPRSPHYFVDVANRQVGRQRFRTYHDVFDAAPDAGLVRAFHAPHSRWIVNVELLPDPPGRRRHIAVALHDLAQGEAVRRDAQHAHDVVGEAEARAELGGMQRNLESYLPDPSTAAAPGDPDALRTAILGSWESPFLNITFREVGTLRATTSNGMTLDGRWSVGADGQLHANVMGGAGSAAATISGDDLTVVLDGQALRLRRAGR